MMQNFPADAHDLFFPSRCADGKVGICSVTFSFSRHVASAVKTPTMGIKIRVEDYDSLRDALREFRRLTRRTADRRRGRARVDYFIKPSQLRRWQKGNAKIRARHWQYTTGGYTPKKE